jgi:biopolymer transport protein ExbB/TolQ
MLRPNRKRIAARAHADVPLDPLLPDDPPFLSFHLWLLIASASVFAFFVAMKSGGLAFVIEHDLTFISDAVMLIFVVTSAYCGYRAWRLSRELWLAQRIAGGDPAHRSDGDMRSWIGSFVQRSRDTADAHSREKLAEVLAERLRGSHEIGWFVTETMTKLGLLGTVIGFLIMLTALVGSNQLELSAMQAILRDMASGMGIKIIATVVGLLCNIVLALQWLLLDRCAEKVLGAALYLSTLPSAGSPAAPVAA